MLRLHRSQAPMAGQRQGGTKRAGRENKGYDDFFDLNGCYFVCVCIRDPSRDRDLETRKEAKHRRKKRMGNTPLLELSRHRASDTGVGRGFLMVASG